MKSEIQRCIDHALDGSNMVKNANQIMEKLRSLGLMQRMQLHPKMVGIHPRNRDGAGVSPQEVHCLLDDIIDHGFVKSKVEAVGIEIEDEEQRQWNNCFITSAGGALGKPDVEQIKVLSVCGSHTNMVLRVFVDAVEHHGNQDVCIQGKLSKATLKEKDPTFFEAVENGVTWEVVPSFIAKEFPQLADIIQQSGNASLNRGENELQMLRRLHNLFMQKHSNGEPVDFQAIKQRALAAKPPFAASLAHMWAFALKFSGGSKAPLLLETELFVRNNVSGKFLSPEIWSSLSGDVSGKISQLARWRHAALKCAYVRGLSASEIKRSFTKELYDKVSEASDVMTEVRALLKQVGETWLSHPQCVNAMGLFECSCVDVVLQRKTKEQYDSLAAVCNDVVVLLSAITKQEIPNRWEHATAAVKMPAVEKPKQSDVPFRELAEDGSMKDPGSLLKEKGFKVGQSVRMKKDQKTSGILVEITGEQVKIDMGKGLIRKVPSKEFLSDSWAVFIPKPLPTLITDFSCSLPHENFEMRMHITKAKISLELQQLTEEHQGCYESLSLQTKPGRAAIVTKKVAVKKLVLIPTTLRVSSQIRDSTLKDQTWEIKTDLADACFWLSPTVVVPQLENLDRKSEIYHGSIYAFSILLFDETRM